MVVNEWDSVYEFVYKIENLTFMRAFRPSVEVSLDVLFDESVVHHLGGQ